MDGSARPFVFMIQSAGIKEQNSPKKFIKIKKNIRVEQDEKWAMIEPFDDLISDGKEVYIAGTLEHLEPAGVHSGDSTAVIPPFSINDEMLREIEEKSKKLALGLNVSPNTPA